MWPLMHPELATAIVDWTSALSPLIIGLLSMLGVSTGFIIVAAIREYWSQKIELMKETPVAEDRRDAA